MLLPAIRDRLIQTIFRGGSRNQISVRSAVQPRLVQCVRHLYTGRVGVTHLGGYPAIRPRGVREAAAAGKTQRQIAAEISRSQPEVSRLLRFDGTSPLGRRVRKHAAEVKRLIAEACGSDVRVFGSVAAGEDGADSDIDLVFTMGRPLSLV